LLNIPLVLFNITVVVLIETECLAKTRKVGGSLVVTLPKELVETEKIREGEVVKIRVKKLRKDGFGLFKGMATFSVEDELKTLE
jgi:hypothetical protein